MPPSIQEDQVSSVYKTIQEELRFVVSRLENALTCTLSQERCNELSGFLETNQPPLRFSGVISCLVSGAGLGGIGGNDPFSGEISMVWI